MSTSIERLRAAPGLRAAFHERPLRPLVTLLADLAHEAPSLEVVRQLIEPAPHAPGVAPPLGVEAELLVRVTGYRLGGERVSRHVAHVDPSRMEAELARALREGRTDLGQLFSRHHAEKGDATSGDERDAPAELRALAAECDGSRRFLWRRYAAALAGRVAVLVAEVLPLDRTGGEG